MLKTHTNTNTNTNIKTNTNNNTYTNTNTNTNTNTHTQTSKRLNKLLARSIMLLCKTKTVEWLSDNKITFVSKFDRCG
jgi:hypothetical protein